MMILKKYYWRNERVRYAHSLNFFSLSDGMLCQLVHYNFLHNLRYLNHQLRIKTNSLLIFSKQLCRSDCVHSGFLNTNIIIYLCIEIRCENWNRTVVVICNVKQSTLLWIISQCGSFNLPKGLCFSNRVSMSMSSDPENKIRKLL